MQSAKKREYLIIGIHWRSDWLERKGLSLTHYWTLLSPCITVCGNFPHVKNSGLHRFKNRGAYQTQWIIFYGLKTNQVFTILLPTEQSAPDSSEEIEQDQEEEHKRRRRRKKRKPTLQPECDKGGAAQVTESSTELSETPANEGGERISKNKKRKLKKKRHKEKLLSMGLMPRATALEFTYKKDGEEGDDGERRAAEVSDFLRTTMKLYMSDCEYLTEHSNSNSSSDSNSNTWENSWALIHLAATHKAALMKVANIIKS